MACVRIRNLEITETLHWVLNPETALPEEFTRQTGLYNTALSDKPVLDSVSPQIAAFVDRDIIVWTHPPRRSTAIYRHFRMTQPKGKELFLQRLAETTLPDRESYALASLAEHFQLPVEGLRRAEQAGIIGAKIFIRLAQQLQQTGMLRLAGGVARRVPAS